MIRDMKIASLLPSATEIIYALGVEDDLVAVTFECNEPVRARQDKRVIVGGLDTSAMSPADIDSYVRARLTAGEDLYTLHEDALAELAPDLILTQDLCRVCAVPTGKVRAALDHLGCRAEVLTLDPYSLSEVLDSIVAVAAATGTLERGRQLVADLNRRLDTVSRAVADRPRPRTAIIEWVDPPFGSGHWMPEMISIAGGEPVAAHSGARSGPTSWDAIRAERPEVMVVAPCGFGLDAAAEQAAVVAVELPGTAIWAIDGDAVIVRPGPRLVEGVEIIARMLHPELGEPPSQTSRLICAGTREASGSASRPADQADLSPEG